MGGNFTEFGIGPVLFFPITAIFSVAMLTLAMTLAVRGMLIAPEKRATFLALFISAATFALIFFYAVMRYRWLAGDTAYDGLYHSIGYLGSIVFGIVPLTNAGAYKTMSKNILFISVGVPILFLVANAVLLSALIGSPEGRDTGTLSMVIGALYASIQIIVPLSYFLYLNSPANKEREIQKRRARSTPPAVTSPQGASTPEQNAPQHTPHGQ
jgi:hypothetical protein